MLVGLSPEEVWEHLERTENPATQKILLDALGGAGERLIPMVRDKLHAASWQAARSAVALLSRLGGRAIDLSGAARHPNEKVRGEVLRALRALPSDEAASDIVVEALADTSAELRSTAKVMLRGEHLSARAVGALRVLAADDDQPGDLRERIVAALGKSPRDEAAEALLQLIHPQGLLDLSKVREQAAFALRRSRAPKAAAYFQEGLGSSVRRVRWACEKAQAGDG
jgi:hypothetical protein